MVEFFIRRPIFATVTALLIVLAGAISIPTLPISLYPALAPPQVVVTTNYIGANSSIVESAVTIPLEQAINGVEGMRYISSVSANDGTSAITVTFRTGYDLNIAAVDVQNRVASASGRLPATVNNTGITITKANSNFVLVAGFISPDHTLSNQFISNYIDVYVKDAVKRVPGVGDATIFGERKYAMRIWLDPAKLAARNLTATDVTNALAEQNVEVAAGQLGSPPNDGKQSYQIAVHVTGRLSEPEQFDNLVLKNATGGSSGLVLLRDVGYAQLGAENYATNLKFFAGNTGGEAIGMGIQQLANANALDVATQCRKVLNDLKKSFPPGMDYVIAVDTTQVVSDSIHEVLVTLIEAIIIVIVVIFLFLQDWRATIIPAVTIPVSLIGTFIFIKLFGFSINSLTLFGITLATGLVVDDAIVVIENVQRHISEGMSDSHEATSIAMKEVTSAVIATSLVLISVFIPVSFFPGTTGILYKQFSLTIAFSIAISAFNALTLSPALAAILLRPEQHHGGLLRLIDNGIKRLGSWYAAAVTVLVRRLKTVMIVLFAAGLAATAYMYQHVPTAFVPAEDQGYFLCIVQTPPGASLAYTTDVADRAAALIRQDKDVLGTFSVMGFSLTGGSSSNSGLIFAPLQPIDQRKGVGNSAKEIVARIAPKLFTVPGGIVAAFEPPAIQGIGTVGGFQFELQDSGRNTFGDIDRVVHTMIGQTRAPGAQLTGLFSPFTANDPQLSVTIDREKAKAIGVPLSQITATLGTFMGSTYVNDFDFNNRSYRVYIQADQQFRRNSQDLQQYYVRSDSGGMVPLQNLLMVSETTGPQVIYHYNLFRSAEIDGSPVPGLSSGQGLQAMVNLFDKNKVQGMTYSWTGLALEEVESAGKAIVIFALGLLVVYLTLSAQYESFALPFIILLAVPMAILGALSLIAARGLVDDVYVQIGLVMLIGLSAKNSILIVEFAEQLLGQGRSVVEAAIEAAELRLRPILMTSVAFILGVLPLYFATGAGALGRHSVGTAVVGGMVLSTVLNLFFIPVLYVLLKTLLLRFGGKAKSPVSPAPLTENPNPAVIP